MIFPKCILCGLIGCLCFAGCAMYEKNEPANELQSITEDVLKRGEGVDIEIKPIVVPKK